MAQFLHLKPGAIDPHGVHLSVALWSAMKTKPEFFLMLASSGLYLICAVRGFSKHADLAGLAVIWSAVSLNGVGAYLMWKRPRA